MRNTRAGTIIAFVLTWIVVLTIGIYLSLPATYAKQYPLMTRVVYVGNYVACKDSNGNIWEFDDADDWCVGDYCNLLMNDCGTADIHDDRIISTYYDRGW